MKFSIIAAALLPALSFASPKPKHCCLTDADAKHILLKWSNIQRDNPKAAGFKTIGELVNATVSENFKSYEETFNNGAQAISFQGRANLLKGVTTKNGPDAITNVSFETVYSFHDCKNIAYRWQYSAVTTGQNKIIFGPGPNDFNPLNTTAVPKGTKFHYKGIDLLVVDPCTKLVTSEYTSQDWLNFLKDIGWVFCPAK